MVVGETVISERGRAVSYAFSLSRVVHPDRSEERYDLLGSIELYLRFREPQELRDGLRPWALATLAAGRYGFGRYYASLDSLDEEGELDRLIAGEYVDWSGSAPLTEMPSGCGPGCPSSPRDSSPRALPRTPDRG